MTGTVRHVIGGERAPARAPIDLRLDSALVSIAGPRPDNQDAGFAALRRAVERNDALRYDEPWGWMLPPRHALGALLLEAGKVADAEAVYREDLRRNPENGWALQGLAECLERQGHAADAASAQRRFADAWKHATVKIAASCYCRRAG